MNTFRQAFAIARENPKLALTLLSADALVATVAATIATLVTLAITGNL